MKYVIPITITDELSKETFLVWFGLLELWTTVGGPIGDGHMVWRYRFSYEENTYCANFELLIIGVWTV